MSKLFEPSKIGKMELKNRFVHSATYEVMAKESGEVTDELVKRYRFIAKGDTALIIPGYMYVHSSGRAYKAQTGIHKDTLIPGLKQVVDTVHNEGGKVAFQLVHAGRQTTKDVAGVTPMGPSAKGRDTVNFVKPREMTEEDISMVTNAFGKAAMRAVEAGADGVQIHAAHGYLVNQFLSPFFNKRKDAWGGSDENMFRFFKEVYMEIKRSVPEDFPILVKLNTHDYTPGEGVTPQLAVKYANWLGELGIDAIEVSCGTALYSFMNECRGEVPIEELVSGLPWWQKSIGRVMLNKMKGNFDLEEGYNLEPAEMIKHVRKDITLMVVGGFRRMEHMLEAINRGVADFISMSRPFIREPFIVKKIKEGKADRVSCISCNKCLAAVANQQPVRCYHTG